MSLLMDALKKAEEAKRKENERAGKDSSDKSTDDSTANPPSETETVYVTKEPELELSLQEDHKNPSSTPDSNPSAVKPGEELDHLFAGPDPSALIRTTDESAEHQAPPSKPG